MLDVLGHYLKARGHVFYRLDGGTCRAQRTIDAREFSRPGSSAFCFLLSTRAGGLGLNLQAADTCILFDSDWNPQADAQAMARVHRIGQTRPVLVLRLVTEGTVEQRIVQRAEKKLFLDSVVTAGGGATAQGGDYSSLLDTIKFGADGILANRAGAPPSDEELDALCDRSEGGEARRAALGSQRQRRSAADFAAVAEAAPLSTFILKGEDLAQKRAAAKAAAKAAMAAPLVGKRSRSGTTMEIDGHTVLKLNNYSLEAGEPSVFAREAAAAAAGDKPARRKVQVAGKDYAHSDWCQLCWEGGDLICCAGCPVALHAECSGTGLSFAQMARSKERFLCPHHACRECGRASAAVGGWLFRCQACTASFCDEHLPQEATICGDHCCARFQRLGQAPPSNACFILCSPPCAAFKDSGPLAAQFVDLPPEGVGARALPLWCKPGDELILMPPFWGRDSKPLSTASFSEAKTLLLKLLGPNAVLPFGLRGDPPLRSIAATRLSSPEQDRVLEAMLDAIRPLLAALPPTAVAPPKAQPEEEELPGPAPRKAPRKSPAQRRAGLPKVEQRGARRAEEGPPGSPGSERIWEEKESHNLQWLAGHPNEWWQGGEPGAAYWAALVAHGIEKHALHRSRTADSARAQWERLQQHHRR